MVFLLTFDVLLPVPSSLVSVAASSLLGLFSGALVIWVGMMAGSLFGYWVGARCNRIFLYKILGEREYSRAEAMMGRFGSGMLITMRAVPILAETSVILAGMAGMQKGRFLLAVTLSNTGVACAYGYIGATAQQESSMLILIAGSVLFAGAGFLLNTWMQHLYSEKAPENGSETVTADSDVGDKTLALEPQWSAQVIKAGFDIHYHYPVIFTRAIFASDNDCIRNLLLPRASSGAGVIVFVDEGVMTAQSSLPEQIAHYFQSCCPSIPVFSIEVVPGGEPCKTRQQIERMQRSMLMYGVDRHCFVFAIGGGAVLDAVGFAAASFHRGVNLVRLPTTVLAQNDAGVGVKNGINDQQKKNLIGAFQPPLAVINDQDFLLTLSQRDKRAGLAEAVKVAAIRDQALFEWMEEHADALAHAEPAALAYSIRECARLHLNQIVQGGDPFEYGTARPLDFGHWSAHRMESLVNYQLRHGEAVAIGIALDTEYAVRAGMLCADKGARVCNLLYQLGFQLWHPVLKQQRENGEAAFLEGLEEFRQHLGGTLCITLLTDIGLATEVNSMDRALLLDARDALARRYAVSAGEQTTEAEPVC
ncbi:MAG: 3-dehydroquinate synthase [Marinobacterium sp.]|nr:3-dehydroquinate synthase [Marinobacterium sp.]